MTVLKIASWLITVTRRMSTDLLPPQSVRGMKVLDRSAFTKDADVPTLRIPSQLVILPAIREILKANALKIQKLKAFQQEDADNNKIIYLDPYRITTWEDIENREVLQENGVSAKDFCRRTVKLDWKNWSAHDVLQSIIGESAPNVAGFSTVGHIVHLNLRPEHDEFKQIVGEVILDKIPTCRTVINKTDNIENEFRNITYELLAGADDLKTVARENGVAFHLDYSQVYWNPRLSTEHERLIKVLQQGAVMYDVFAGIGPFAVPAGKKGCTVLANDLNPASYEYLVKNIAVNKVTKKVTAFNQDGREFIRTVIKDDMALRWKEAPDACLHIVMNLPASAEEFVSEFKGLLHACPTQSSENQPLSSPLVHLYCFDKEGDPRGSPWERLNRNLGWELEKSAVTRSFVRQVAPTKDMVRLDFALPWEVLTAIPDAAAAVKKDVMDQEISGDAEPESKRRKIL